VQLVPESDLKDSKHDHCFVVELLCAALKQGNGIQYGSHR
jgi:hypothetical protein